MNETDYSCIADALVKRGYIVINDALSIKLIDKLLEFSKNETLYNNAKISSTQKSHLDSTKRSDKTQWLDEDDATQSEYLRFMGGLREYLNRSLYLGLIYYEAHFSIFDKGDFYEKHLDAFVGRDTRIITTLLYLNKEWSSSDEGNLIIYSPDGEILKEVIPKGNTMVVFLSDKFPHEVLKTKKKRYSIAGWFRTDSR
ncbi:2OG-Fe(II) oxygenase [Sulfurimonas sp. SAG-AH-194-L11]|nr:2OG-Fe(II) oxygenase [Sulfurimonas sp. SAG-AH-194-L11]MDF1877403.1 2OG-Fe(II) oxygenase [Sulfurimonas sp. SAG-AH-194-L11]